MNQNLKEILWRQFGASIDALDNAVEMCPADVWAGGNFGITPIIVFFGWIIT